jgi:hypothetical protein
MRQITIDLDDPKDIRRKIASLRKEKVALPWEKDGSVPPKYIRKNVLGEVVAKADRFLGGYANPHKPDRHGWGWRAEELPHVGDGIEKTLEKAKKRADTWLKEGHWKLLEDKPSRSKKKPQRVSKKRSRKKTKK